MKKYLIMLIAAFTLAGRLAMAADIQVTQLIFEEIEPGLDPYTSRILMNKRYLRFDEGDDVGNFVLFDRVLGEIHNFNHEEKSEFIVQRTAPLSLDIPDAFTIQRKALQHAPRIGEMLAVEHRFFADGQLCKTSVNFDGLLVDVAKAIIQYQYVLMQQNSRTFSSIPDNIKSPCYLANNYLHQSADLKVGFPVHVLDYQGREKRLLDFGEVTKSSKIFDRPEGYQIYYPTL